MLRLYVWDFYALWALTPIQIVDTQFAVETHTFCELLLKI